MAFNIKKFYSNILGLDLRVSDLLRNQSAATEAKNVMYRQTGAVSKRNGFQVKTDKGTGGGGLVKYNNVEIGTGTVTEELLTIDDNLEKLTDNTFTITYSGSGSASYDLYLDTTTATFTFELFEDGASLFSTDCGTGYGVSDTTVAQIKTLVDAETNFSMAISGDTSTPIAFAPISRSTNITSSGTVSTYYTFATVDMPGTYTTPFSGHWATRNDTDFEIASYAQALDVIYITNGTDDLHKYDGNRVYKAGVPQPDALTDGVGAGGSLTAGVYQWKYTYDHTDAKQNIITGQESAPLNFTSAGADSRDLTMDHLAANSGYGVAQAVVNGTQSGVTSITVNSGHDIKVGDYVYINDGITSSVISREVSAITATTIDIEGATVDVTNTDAISQLKITLWRTKSDAQSFYLIKEFVNDTTNATITYTSTNADASLVVEKIDPIKIPSLPPKCRYIDVWRNQLVMTGNKESVNTVYYSDFDIESFPQDQSFLTESRLGGGNSGIKALDNSLYVFKPRSIFTVTGDLGTDSFQVDGLGDDGVGCVANATIQEINGVLWFMGRDGIYTVNRQGHTEKSEQIEPKFNESFSQKRAVSHYWIEKDLYMVSFPYLLEDGSSNKYFDATNSFTMVFDLYREAWVEWTNINLLGGITNYNGNIFVTGPAQDPIALTQTIFIYQFLDSGLEDDYADHEIAIEFSYKSHWEAMGEPSIYKKFLRIKVHALDGTIGDFETDKFSLVVNTEHDYVQGAESSLTLDFSGGSLGWGNSSWGEFIWGESRLEQLTSKLKSKKAKALRTVFQNNTLHENVLISGYELEIAAAFDLQIKE